MSGLASKSFYWTIEESHWKKYCALSQFLKGHIRSIPDG